MNGAIIGSGHGRRVIKNAFNSLNINLIGIFSKNIKKAIYYKKNIKKYKSLDELIKDKKIELIAIAVPAYYQVDLIYKCLLNNKIVFCEKPITHDFSELKKINNYLKKNKKNFIVDYIFQEHNAFKKFKNILPKKINQNSKVKVIFRLNSYNNKFKINNWKNYQNLGGGIINLYLPHILEYLILFFGKIKKCKILIKYKNYVEIHYKFKSGLDSYIEICSDHDKKEHSVIYEDQKYKFILKNTSNDYAKGFTLNKFAKLKNKNKTFKYIDNLEHFKSDGRIFLTKKLLQNYKQKFNKNNYLKKIDNYLYIESILDKTRKKYKLI